MSEISFLRWVCVNVKRRLVVATTILLLAIMSIQVIFAINARQEQWQQFSTFGQIIADAVRNRNMSSIQNTALLVLKDLRGDWVALTDKDNDVLWSFPQIAKAKHDYLSRELRLPIVTIQGDINLLASVPIFPNQPVLISLALSTILFVTVLFWAIIGVIKRLSKDFSYELGKLESNSGEIFITELENTRRHISALRSTEASHAAMAAIGRISSQIAHDMRSPLSVLQSYVNCGTEMKADEALEYKEAASRSVSKLLQMAEDLVDYSKASKIVRNSIDLGTFIRDSVIKEIDIKAREKEMHICCRVNEDAIVSIDANKIGRVLVNIIDNAIQAIQHHQGEIIVETGIGNEKELAISISDNGTGIEEQQLPHIFETFYTSGKKQGTGLGLSFCKQVVEAHGGTIEVQSRPQEGSTFTIRIPNCAVK
jgi:signal transduction histidine kinase